MNEKKYNALASEIVALEELLTDIPEENVLERMGFEARLKTAHQSIKKLHKPDNTKKATLVFRGQPVCKSYGINAEFATKAMGKFTDTVTAVAASLADNLSYMGPLPDKQKNQLLITGTAIGSFGFEFEVPQIEQTPSNVEQALDKVQELLRLTVKGSDDEMTDLIDEIHPRAVKKVADFLEYTSTQEAWCGLEFKGQVFRFDGLKQLRHSAERLQEDNIQESDKKYSGEFQGILPTSRTFEFKLDTEDTSVIRGKIGSDIEDTDSLNQQYLHQPVTIQLHIIQVGHGRPRYSLLSLSDINKNY